MSDRKHQKVVGRKQKLVERRRKLRNRRRRIQYRLRDINWTPQDEPMFTAGNIHYELPDLVRGLGPGGIRPIISSTVATYRSISPLRIRPTVRAHGLRRHRRNIRVIQAKLTE